MSDTSDTLAANLFPNLVNPGTRNLSVQARIFARMHPNVQPADLAHAALDGAFTNAHSLSEAHDVVIGRGPRMERRA